MGTCKELTGTTETFLSLGRELAGGKTRFHCLWEATCCLGHPGWPREGGGHSVFASVSLMPSEPLMLRMSLAKCPMCCLLWGFPCLHF